MGRSPCCDKVGLKKGPWTPEEDQKLLAYIQQHGRGSWRSLPAKAGLQRCGKSCRLRWTNYLRPDIKRGKFSLQEEQTIIQLHALLGNRWSAIATHLSKRTDNEIKNYWNTHLKKRLDKMGIDPITHKPKNDALLSTNDAQSKNAANLSHMAQWESARLEAEARLVRESKIRSHFIQHQQSNPPGFALESPTSTLTVSENAHPIITRIGVSPMPMIELVGTTSGSCETTGIVKEEGDQEWKELGSSNNLADYEEGLGTSLSSFTSSLHDMTISMEGGWTPADAMVAQTNALEPDSIGSGSSNETMVENDVGEGPRTCRIEVGNTSENSRKNVGHSDGNVLSDLDGIQATRRSVSLDLSDAMGIAGEATAEHKHGCSFHTGLERLEYSRGKIVGKHSRGSSSMCKLMKSCSVGRSLSKGPVPMKRCCSSGGIFSLSKPSKTQGSILPL